MPTPRAVLGNRLIGDALTVPGCGSTLHRGVPLWLRLAILPMLAAVVLPSIAAAGDFDPSENPWGFGYDGGLTLRRKIAGKWEVGITGGPNDFLSTRTEVRDRESDPPTDSSTTRTETDTRREGGFVATHFGRSVLQRGSFDLICYLRGLHQWANWKTENESQGSNGSLTHDWTDRDERDWSLSLGFRPGYRPVAWFSIEVTMGLTYTWTNETLRQDRLSINSSGSTDRYVTTANEDGQTFRYFGYSGTSSLLFILWF